MEVYWLFLTLLGLTIYDSFLAANTEALFVWRIPYAGIPMFLI